MRQHEKLQFAARTAENEAARLAALHEKRDTVILSRLSELQDALEELRLGTKAARAELEPLEEQRARYVDLHARLLQQMKDTKSETAALVDRETRAEGDLEALVAQHQRLLADLREAEDHCEKEEKTWIKKQRETALRLRGVVRQEEELRAERDRQLRVTEDLALRAQEAQDDMQTKVGVGSEVKR